MGNASSRPPIPGILDQWHSQPRKLRIIHVGAGAADLCFMYKVKTQLTDYEIVTYEKNSDIGGTWMENRYPGCACDIPAHIYTFSFEPNPRWSTYYASAVEIEDYFLRFCDKYNLKEQIKLKHQVTAAVWHEDKAQWEVTVENDGQKFTDYCDILVNDSGLLNKWKWPAIPGIESFKGTLMHSAHWDPTSDCTNKTVAVLGTGSSAIQIVPHVQKVASKVKCFMRSSTWIAPPLPRIPVKLDEQPSASVDTVTDDQQLPEDEGQYYYTEQEIKKLEQDPAFLLDYRKQIEFKFNQVFALFYKDSAASQQAVEHMTEVMKRRLKDHPELCQRLIPSWPVGCRRLTPGPDYLEALIASNVEPIYDDITSIDASGLTTADGGQHHAVDVIICATGFDLAWTPHYPIVGRNGKSLQEAWAPWPKCYLGVAAPGFPNYWQMNGPRGNLGNGPVLSAVETQAEFVIKAIKKMQADRIKILEVRQDVTERLDQRIDMWMQGAVWSADCKSWYKNNMVNGKPMVWGGSSLHYLKTIRYPRWEHFEMDYLEEDPWAFLGNGSIKAEVDQDFDGMTSYLRRKDVPWDIE